MPKNGLESSAHYRKNALAFKAISTDLALSKNSPRILAEEPLVDWGSDETTKFFAISKNWWT
jgi:hypothetical protein